MVSLSGNWLARIHANTSSDRTDWIHSAGPNRPVRTNALWGATPSTMAGVKYAPKASLPHSTLTPGSLR